MRDIPQIEVEMAFLPKAEGGREQPPIFTTPTSYRPHLTVGGSDLLGVIFLVAPEFVKASIPFIATLGLVYHPNVDYHSLTPGVEFNVLEGSQIVGRGRVLKEMNTNAA